MSQLRSAASALSPREEEPTGGEEQDGSRSPARESEKEDEMEKDKEQEKEKDKKGVSGEQRAEALKALLLKRKRKHQTSEQTGMCHRLSTSSQLTLVNYSSVK